MAKKKDEDAIPTGRVRRTAKVGGLAAGQTARNYATKAANMTRDADGRRAAAEKRQLDAAEQIVDVLGQMKGAAMKVGQVMSFMDTGALPPDVQERFQAKLGALRDSAPKVSFEDMRKVIEADLEEPLEDVFDEFEEQALAAASIGQVYRARTQDGRQVAVKVQYPAVAAAVRADMQNLGLILRAARSMAPGIDAKAMAAEIRERIYEELDYEHEAQAQRQMARLWRGHPFVVIPDVVTSLSRERVLVTEWVEGKRFDDVMAMPSDVRDTYAETVLRFFVGGFYRTGFISGDPHPGNFLLQDDGRVAFLDFGMTRHVSREHIAAKIELFRAGLDADAVRYHAAAAGIGFFPADDERVTPELAIAHFHAVSRWWREDAVFTIDQPYIRQVMIDLGDPRSDYWAVMKRSTIPPEAMIAGRAETLTLGVLGQLEATGNWHRIMTEYICDNPPSTPLGEQDAEFWDGRPVKRAGLSPDAVLEVSEEALAHLGRDDVMAGLIELHGAIDLEERRRGRPSDPYGALLRSIVGQQLSVKAARSIYTRLTDMFGGKTPTPRELLDADPETLRGAGLSRPKVSYLRDLAQHVEDGTLHLTVLDNMTDSDVVAELTRVKGLGEWTAQMFLMFHLHRPDVLPVGDLGIRRAVERNYGLEGLPDAETLERLGERWRPYRTLASIYLWHSLDNAPD